VSQTATKLPLQRARWIAEAVVTDLAPGCTRIEIAGSVRRRKPECGDIEIVAIPREPEKLVVGSPGTLLDQILDKLCRGQGVSQRTLIQLKAGDRYKQYEIVHAGCRLDLFLCTPETWGWILLLRTGPETFTKRVVTKRQHGGLCPLQLRFEGGRIWQGDKVLPTPEEIDVFKALMTPWREPWERG
jgi:DNA polymerase/3'-5' exonuclease PolX